MDQINAAVGSDKSKPARQKFRRGKRNGEMQKQEQGNSRVPFRNLQINDESRGFNEGTGVFCPNRESSLSTGSFSQDGSFVEYPPGLNLDYAQDTRSSESSLEDKAEKDRCLEAVSVPKELTSFIRSDEGENLA